MPDALAASFDALPYRHGAAPLSHPARLGAIARLLGVPGCLPQGCRLLELGCGEGMNLLPLAERFPGASFLGVDFSPAQIDLAERARVAAELTNTRLLCEDLRVFEPEPAAYDYVIANGVYSWVDDAVKDRLLGICARALAPGGVACVTYNVFPGWGLLGGLRAMLRAELSRATDRQERLGQLLPALEAALAAQPGPYATLMREAVKEMRHLPPALLFHDELEATNDPVSFLDFIAHSSRHNLHYLGEAEFASLPFEHLPAEVRAPLGPLGLDFAGAQQFLDLLGNRRIRASLLTRTASPAERRIDASVVSDCAIRSYLWPVDGRLDLSPGVPAQLRGRHQFQLAVVKPEQKAFFAALCEARPGALHFRTALARAAELLQLAGLAGAPDAALLAAGVARLFATGQCDLLLAGDSPWFQPSAGPQPSPLMRFQAREGLAVTNLWHENVDVTRDERRWLAGEAVEVNEEALLRSGLGV